MDARSGVKPIGAACNGCPNGFYAQAWLYIAVPGGMKRIFPIVLAFLAVAYAGACGGPEATDSPAPILVPLPTATAVVSSTVLEPTGTAPAKEGIDWKECGIGVQCGYVDVPADYLGRELGSLRIAVNIRRAESPAERIGYLLVNPGGPGESGVEFVLDAYYEVFADELRRRFDIVGFDPRGVGASEPEFACGAPGERLELLGNIELPVDTPEEVAAGEAAANLCIESMGAVGGLLHSEYVARDMDEIRKALEVDEISYLGFSYGSTLGVWYATLFPEAVRAMAVDGADNPVDAADTQQERIEEALEEVASFEVLLEEALLACASAECLIYNAGDPVGYYKRAAEKLELVNRAAANHPLAGFMGVITALYSEDLWPYLWTGLYLLEAQDDPSILLELALLQLGEDPAAPRITGHVNCLDGLVLHPELDRQTALEDSEAIDAAARDRVPLLAATVFSSPSVCPFYDQFAPDPLGAPLDGGEVPILVIGNRLDPATSFGESVELVTKVLRNGYLVEVSHPAHTVYPDDSCVNGHVHRALIDGEYPPERLVSC